MRFNLRRGIFLRFSVILCGFSIASAEHWSYTNPHSSPDHWEELFQTCKPIRQSPIDILKSETIFDPKLKQIKIRRNSNLRSTEAKYKVSNNGHTAMISFPQDMWYLTFDNDDNVPYSILQMHFHWGSENGHGSEHLLNGHSYPIEAHVVAYNKKLYPNSSQATSAPEGLAALGFLGELSQSKKGQDTFFGALGDFESILEDIKSPESSRDIDPFNLQDTLKFVNPSNYYRYAGSLTTPPCTPNVIWTVFHKPFPVTNTQLERLRSLAFPKTEKESYMQNNYRPVQPLNSDDSLIRRSVYVSWNAASRTTGSALLTSMLLVKNII